MEPNVDTFLQQLKASKLLSATVLEKIAARLESFPDESFNDKTAKRVLSELVTGKRLSQWQADVLSAGQTGPFRVGNYRLVKRIESGPLAGAFVASHVPSKHPVLLQFISGSQESDLATWQAMSALANRVREIRHPRVVSFHESVSVPGYRFIASECPLGKPLSEKLPAGAKVPWKKACLVVADVAAGLAALHRTGVIHNSISPRTVWLHKTAGTQLRVQILSDDEFEPTDPDQARELECKHDYTAPEISVAGSTIDERSDLYALGCLLFRLLTGKVLFESASPSEKTQLHLAKPPNLEHPKIPPPVAEVLQQLLAKLKEARIQSAEDLAKRLRKLAGQEVVSAAARQSLPTLEAYEAELSRWLPTEEKPTNIGIPSPTTSKTDIPDFGQLESQLAFAEAEATTSVAATDETSDFDPAAIKATPRKRPRKKRRSVVRMIANMVTSVSLLATSGLAAWFVYQTWLKPPAPTTEPATVAISESVAETSSHNSEPATEAAAPAETEPFVRQILLDDDQKTLWESPTGSEPIDFSWLPPSPATIVVLRVAELLGNPEGLRMKQALGPMANEVLDAWFDRIEIPPNQIERMVVSFHLNAEFEYEPFFLIDLKSPVTFDDLPFDQAPSNDETSDYSNSIHSSNIDDQQILLTRLTTASEETPRLVEQFAVGSAEQIQLSSTTEGKNLLAGAMGNLSELSDSDRHLTVLTLRNSWFNDAGQALMGHTLSDLNRQLRLAIDENITAASLSLHLDQGSYLEFRFAYRSGAKTAELTESTEAASTSLQKDLLSYLQTFSANGYWTPVRKQMGAMLKFLRSNLRWGVESRTVVANCWLPPHAPHNLLAAAELVTWQSQMPIVDTAASSNSAPPQSLEELLQVRRTLEINNPPDLGVLLAGFQDEIQNDFPQLPFKFSIKVSGPDLKEEGITQNQRPGKLSIQNQTVAEILTSIMVSANPDKTISGPTDPNCKLVWTVATAANDPDHEMIIVTSRAAAARAESIRPEFRTGN